jgi:hypothetical protein
MVSFREPPAMLPTGSGQAASPGHGRPGSPPAARRAPPKRARAALCNFDPCILCTQDESRNRCRPQSRHRSCRTEIQNSDRRRQAHRQSHLEPSGNAARPASPRPGQPVGKRSTMTDTRAQMPVNPSQMISRSHPASPATVIPESDPKRDADRGVRSLDRRLRPSRRPHRDPPAAAHRR